MLSFLQKILNAQIIMTLLAMGVSTFLLVEKLLSEVFWVQVFLGSYGLFVGGGFLKEGWTAFLDKRGSE